jgi:hypothetical protein
MATSGVVASPPTAGSPVSDDRAAQLILEYAAGLLGDPAARLIATPISEVRSPGGAGRFVVGKVVSRASGRAVVAYVNRATGELLDQAAFRALDAADASRRGKLSPDLVTLLARPDVERITVAVSAPFPSAETIPAQVRAAFPGATFSRGQPDTSDDKLNTKVRGALRAARAAEATAASGAIARKAKALGLSVEYAGLLAPVVWVTGTPDQVRRLAKDPGVAEIDASYLTAPTMATAGATDQASSYSYALGHIGGGTRIAVVEYANVDWSLADLNKVPASRRAAYSTGAIWLDPHRHASWVMGAIASQTAGHRGVAPGAFYVSSGTGGYVWLNYDYKVMQAVDNAVLPTRGNADVVNLSFVQDTGQNGQPGSGAILMKAYIDNVVRAYGVHVAASAGNRDLCGDWRVQSPGTAWNVVTVGGIDDRNTSGWSDDAIWTGACYGDPPGGTFKPEISAPAVCVQVVGSSCSGSTGTSIASPQVAGTLGVIIGINPAELRAWPVKTKAILLAAAGVHRVSKASGGLDDREGLGSLTTKWADIIASRRSLSGAPLGDFGVRTFNRPSASSCVPPSQTISVSNLAPRKMRVVATWQSHGSYDRGSNGYDPTDSRNDARYSDFDIYLRTKSGTLKDSSTGLNWNTEWVEWTASAAEMPYQIEIRPSSWNCSLPAESVGWAWVAWSAP